MRILLVSSKNDRSMGGALSILETTAEAISILGHEVEILFIYKSTQSIGIKPGFKINYLGAHSALDFAAISRFVSLARKGEYSIIHFVDQINILSIISSLVHPCTVLHVHGREWGSPIHLYWLSRIRTRLSAATIAITFGAKRSLIERGVAPASKVSVIPNAVHHRFFYGQKSTIRSSVRPKDNTQVILGFAARHNSCKSPEEAVRLLQWLPNGYKLLVAGEGEQTSFLRHLVSSLDLERRVNFIGTIDDMTQFFADIDYYLFFSKYEGLGLVIAEAMARDVPVVGLCGEGEYFEAEYPLVDSSTALLLPRTDPFLSLDQASSVHELGALADAILALEGDSIRRSSMIKNARSRVETYFHPRRYGGDLEAFYRVVCGELITPCLPHHPSRMRSS